MPASDEKVKAIDPVLPLDFNPLIDPLSAQLTSRLGDVHIPPANPSYLPSDRGDNDRKSLITNLLDLPALGIEPGPPKWLANALSVWPWRRSILPCVLHYLY